MYYKSAGGGNLTTQTQIKLPIIALMSPSYTELSIKIVQFNYYATNIYRQCAKAGKGN